MKINFKRQCSEISSEKDLIWTPLGNISKSSYWPLVEVRATALKALREGIEKEGHTEVTTSSIVNVAGSCENPNFSFPLDFHGKPAFLVQSAQLQLEVLVLRMNKGVYTVNNSFREENYEDPESAGRRLSEFTLVEAEKPYPALNPAVILEKNISVLGRVIKHAIGKCLSEVSNSISFLAESRTAHVNYLEKVVRSDFSVISYQDALRVLNQKRESVRFGDDLTMKHERLLLAYSGGTPLFVTQHPASIKYFNMKRSLDGKICFSVDLLMPKLGETAGGSVRAETIGETRIQLKDSKMGEYYREHGLDPETFFHEHFKAMGEEKPTPRAGFGIGFERFAAFLLESNDILHTVRYKSFQP